MSERFRLFRKALFDWLTGRPPQLKFHGIADCPGHKGPERWINRSVCDRKH